ncbi:hypothetical protein LX87_05568 [Larkinella arboricola]|uniref:Uncharacterized protein n=1 Tax=Larkinella arboricola TaxID=643671 RepID=A0A327WJJ3_LARAB|nr:hypothetical protein [Larkinella arboricola]RAJ90042.1 hypothetical protein LX87_05568 [Larkinella arboricola]
MMVESLILLEGEGLKEENLWISLTNAKQLIVGFATNFGVVLHIGANSADDLQNAFIEFAKVEGVTAVVTMMIHVQK